MRLPFNLTDSKLEGARVKFQYSSPELNQNIEISLDGEETSLEDLLDAFERFIGALGIVLPENAMLAVIEVEEGEEEDADDEEDSSNN